MVVGGDVVLSDVPRDANHPTVATTTSSAAAMTRPTTRLRRPPASIGPSLDPVIATAGAGVLSAIGGAAGSPTGGAVAPARPGAPAGGVPVWRSVSTSSIDPYRSAGSSSVQRSITW